MYVNALIDFGMNTVFAVPLEAVVKAVEKCFIFILKINDDNDKATHFQRIEDKKAPLNEAL